MLRNTNTCSYNKPSSQAQVFLSPVVIDFGVNKPPTPVAVFRFALCPFGVQVGGYGLCLEAVQTRSQKNTCQWRRIPPAEAQRRCARCVRRSYGGQDSLIELIRRVPCVFDHSPLICFQELYCFTNALGVGFWTITKAFFEFG